MIIPVHCVDCGKLIRKIDTAKSKSFSALNAPCGERVCEDCCRKCGEDAKERGEPCQKVKKYAV